MPTGSPGGGFGISVHFPALEDFAREIRTELSGSLNRDTHGILTQFARGALFGHALSEHDGVGQAQELFRTTIQSASTAYAEFINTADQLAWAIEHAGQEYQRADGQSARQQAEWHPVVSTEGYRIEASQVPHFGGR